MSHKAPLAMAVEMFASSEKDKEAANKKAKAALVAKVVDALAAHSEEPRDELRDRLKDVSNRKLFGLLDVASTVKEKYGSRDKLVAGVADALGRTKDKDFVARLDGMSLSRLLDLARVAARKAGRKAAGKAAAGTAATGGAGATGGAIPVTAATEQEVTKAERPSAARTASRATATTTAKARRAGAEPKPKAAAKAPAKPKRKS